MGVTGTATSDAYFEERWALGDDPWEHGSRWYETRKYDLTGGGAAPPAVPSAPSSQAAARGSSPSGSPRRSREHLAMERHPRGVAATADRCRDLPTVTVVEGCIPADWPAGTFDLIVLSEVLYYLEDDALDEALRCAHAALPPGGDLVAVHYRPVVEEHVRTGDDVHRRLDASAPWERLLHLVGSRVRPRRGAPVTAPVDAIVVGIPARDEEAAIGRCLTAVIDAAARLDVAVGARGGGGWLP